MKIPVLVCAGLVLAACGSPAPTEPTIDLLSVRATTDSLFVTNRAVEPLYLFMVDDEELALMSYALCQTRQECGPGLAPGTTLRRSTSSLDASHDGVRRVFIGARVFRTGRRGVDAAVDIGSLTVSIPQ